MSPDLLTAALGLWLGMQALRWFFGTVAWNIREHLPAAAVPVSLLLVASAGVSSGLIARRLEGKRPCVKLAWVFSACWIGSQAISQPQVSAIFVVGAAAAWFCWLPAFAAAVARRGRADSLVPGFLLGLAADSGLRTWLHGLDLPVAGSLPVTLTLLAGFIASTAALGSEGPSASALDASGVQPARGIVLFGPYLFLQLSLLANPGRLEMLGSWPVPAHALVFAALLAAVGGVQWVPPVVSLAAPIGALLLMVEELPAAFRLWLCVPVQVGATVALAVGFSRIRANPADIYRGWVAASALFFLLAMLYYVPPILAGKVAIPPRSGWHGAWLMAALGLGTVTYRWREGPARLRALRPAIIGTLLIAALSVALGSGRWPGNDPDAPLAPAELKVLTYNVQYGFDARGRPVIPQLADFIRERQPDLVALQEVSRGDLVHGGLDLASYLRWRLPAYELVFGRSHDDLAGNVVLSRFPVRESGHFAFRRRRDVTPRGLTWPRVPTIAGEVLFASAHLGGGPDSESEAAERGAFWARQPRTVIAGDFNAVPNSPPDRLLRKLGLLDVPAALGLGDQSTVGPNQQALKLDYVRVSPDIEPRKAQVPVVALSDHLPVEVVVRVMR